MAISLDGAFLKLDRALERIHAFNAEILTFRSLGTHKVVTDRDADSGEHVVRLSPTASAPEFWPVVIGEIVHDLRSSLDHLVWQLANLAEGEPDPAAPLDKWRTYLQFPIIDKPPVDGFKAATVRTLRHVSGPDKTRIENEQPYVRSQNDPTGDLLARLRELSNIDKHRTLHVTYPFLWCYKDTPCITIQAADAAITGLWMATTGPLGDDPVLARFRLDPDTPNPNLNVEPNLMLEVSLGEQSPLAGWPLPIAMALVSLHGKVLEVLCRFQDRVPVTGQKRTPRAVLLDARVGPVQIV